MNKIMEIIKHKNVIDTMTRNVLDAIDQGKEALELPEFIEPSGKFKRDIEKAISLLNKTCWGIK